MDWWQVLALDIPPLFTAIFSALACALLGNYLILRRQALMGDAIAHSVLPGIVFAFLLTSSRGGLTVFVGAALAGILSALLIELTRKYGQLDSGAAMGVVFSIFFALGVLIIEQAAARSVDLDADCLLHGQLESIFWYPPRDLAVLFSISTLSLVPTEVWSSFGTFVVTVLFIVLLFKELKISSFDPALSTSLGFSSTFIHNLLMAFVACAVVASFKAVGTILVIAMIICPAACARMCTDKLRTQLLLSSAFAVMSCIGGYVLGAFGPIWLGYENSLNIAGMISVVAGALLVGSIVFAPHYGVLGKAFRRLQLLVRVMREDTLGFLYRLSESDTSQATKERIFAALTSSHGLPSSLLSQLAFRQALASLSRDALVLLSGPKLQLTAEGSTLGAQYVRSHRLWEQYLVDQLGLAPEQVHPSAETLEHFTEPELQKRLDERVGFPETDPHGKEIPDGKG